MPRTLVIVPTYNEARALPVLLEQLAKLSVDVLVVDDDSPDGTGNIAAAFASSFPRIHILNRTAKAGLASAYNDGFRWARGRGYDFIAQMDADGSHRVADLLKLLKRAAEPDQVDLVIGSRWVRGGRVVGWAKWRELLSRAGNLYIRAVLGLPQKDITAGFRVYSRRTFALLEPKTLSLIHI